MRRQTQQGNVTCLESQTWAEHVASSLAPEALASLGTSGSPTVCSAVTRVSFVYCNLWWATCLEDALPHVTARACPTLMVTEVTPQLWSSPGRPLDLTHHSCKYTNIPVSQRSGGLERSAQGWPEAGAKSGHPTVQSAHVSQHTWRQNLFCSISCLSNSACLVHSTSQTAPA